MNKYTKVSTQVELDAAIKAKDQFIEIHGEWDEVVIPRRADITRLYIYGTAKVGSVDISGTAKVGSVDISGTVTGSVYIYGTAKVGSVDISGTAKVGSVDISGTVTGSVYIYGTAKVGSVYISGTVTGSVYISGTAKVGSVYIYGTAKVGSVDISGTVTGSVYISGTAKVGSVDISGTVTGSVYIYGTAKVHKKKLYFGGTLDAVEADHAIVLGFAKPEEIAGLRAALVAGRIDGHLYDGECRCLVGTLEKVGQRDVVTRDSSRLAEKWYLAMRPGHTPANSTYVEQAVQWIDTFTAAQK